MIAAFVIAMAILFLHATTWKGHIFQGIKKIVPPDQDGHMWYKALYGCPICMTPWWGSLAYLLFFWSCLSVKGWLYTVGGAAGINVLSVVFLTLRSAALCYIEKNEKK